MPREIIQNGATANDGTGDNLRVTADKINRMFGELYGVFRLQQNGNLRLVNTNGTVTIGAGANGEDAPAITIPNSINGAILLGTPTNPISIGNPAAPAISVPTPGIPNSILRIAPPVAGRVVIGDPSNTNAPGISIPAAGGNAPITIGNPSGGINIGNPGSPGISIPAPGSAQPIKIGDPNAPAITVPSNPQQPVQLGSQGQPVDVVTGLDKWELIYTGDDGKLDSSPFLKVTTDGDDNEGKSLHLHTALYSSGNNSKLQSTIYFVDDVAAPNRGGYAAETTESKRAASVRFVKQSLGQGLVFSPWANFDDSAFHNKGGVSVWRTTYGGNPATKVTLNDDGAGPSIHGLYLGSGALSFFQDLAGGQTPNANGLTYIVLPGIPDSSGANKVGQIFANPYRNRTEDGNSGVPYFGLGWKQSTQLLESGGGQSGIEATERVPGNEVITWHTTNRVGIMNNDPNWTLSVTGDVAFTNTLRVGNAENAGTDGQVLASTGSTTAPIWKTLNIPVDTFFDKGTGGGNLVFDRNQGTIQKIVLNGNVTDISIQNMSVAQSFTIIFVQDSTASRTLTTSSAFKYASGFKTLTTTANAIDMMNIFFDGSTYYCTLTTGYA